MLLLKVLRRRVVGLDEHVRRLAEADPLPRAVVITFDDGYVDNYEVARPILRRFGYGATIFLVSGRLGGVNGWDADGDLAGRRLLDLRHVRELVDGGITFGAHTRSHASLPGLGEALLADEIGGSRADLEAALGCGVDIFAYPYGRVDAAATRAVAVAGFSAAFTTRPGLSAPGNDPYLLPRVEVGGRESLVRFVARLFGWGEVSP